MRWVTSQGLTAERGYTKGQQKARIQRKHWRRGIEFADVDGARLFDIDAIDRRATDAAQAQRSAATREQVRVVRLR